MKAELHTPSGQQKAISTDHLQPRLLLVDDENSILTSLAALLRYCRPEFHIGLAHSAEEALLILKENEVDLLVTDLKLPEMDGLRLVQETLKQYPETRSILMTAYGTDSIDYGAYQSGCISYLEKPFDVEKLLESVDETLRQKSRKEKQADAGLAAAVAVAAREGLDVSIRLHGDGHSGLLVIRNQRISYADYAGLVGISALIAMLDVEAPRIECTEVAPELNNADLPVLAEAFVKAALLHSTSQQIALLRRSGREVLSDSSEEYPQDLEREAEKQRSMLTELLQRLRELRLDAEAGSQVERKRLHFYQSLEKAAIEKQVKLRNLVNSGIEEFANRNYDEARLYWSKALELDPHCQQAKHNLALLEKAS